MVSDKKDVGSGDTGVGAREYGMWSVGVEACGYGMRKSGDVTVCR